jgi:hypothetical protein
MSTDSLNDILGIQEPEPLTVIEPQKTVIEQAADIIQAESITVVPTEGTPATVGPTTIVVAEPAAKPIPVVHDPEADELRDDMGYARTTMKDVIMQAQGALTGALELADSGGEARAYEVVALMVSSIIDANRQLINIHKVRKDAQKTDKETKGTGDTPAQIQVQNAVFVGRAQDLLRTMKDLEKQAKEL